MFVDIGAHAGTYSTRAAAIVGTNGRVFAIEPNPTLAQWIRESAAQSFYQQLAVLNYAVGPHDGNVALNPSEFQTANASIVSHGSKAHHTVTVPCITPQSLVRTLGTTTPDVIKIDAEGLDAFIVHALIVAGMRPTAMVFEHLHESSSEAWSESPFPQLRAAGYTLHCIAKSWLSTRFYKDGEKVPVNCYDFVAIRDGDSV